MLDLSTVCDSPPRIEPVCISITMVYVFPNRMVVGEQIQLGPGHLLSCADRIRIAGIPGHRGLRFQTVIATAF